MDEEDNIYGSGIYADDFSSSNFETDANPLYEGTPVTPSDWGNNMYSTGIYNESLPWQDAQENNMYDYSYGGTANPADYLLKNASGDFSGFINPASGDPSFYSDLGQGQGNALPNIGSISNVLSNLFSGQQGKGALSGLGAIIEGMQNKKKASSIQNIVNQQQARTDPFGAQRPFYQQQLQSTVQNPYTQPMVRDQVAQIAKAQAIKDAAAGRRSNSATSSPAMLAAQAAVAQQYMNSLMTPAGANIAPNGGGLEALLQGNAANVHGYASPIMSALGYNQQTNSNQAQIDALRKLLTGGQ